ncbi:biopolymer transporter ExbD [Aestuariirhabdus sp. Z084]|uniref:ExbD/TolR family protein n=1 Tax=Aestuariirhabdus haliotis TaxID=2918751 RepID=UPI00201B447F|nr:biopolymer transporter ExbD [Aestuariirhabdus haliotis]MCL6417473.1 biopolymer transporter ExbD [Aestuariirhabdus haliotis]MCL6421408.1 biopolymer transporter ExbD [Aestuariirhabdus haliotis]
MIRAHSTQTESDSPTLELTPMIDIVFIVIVFLLITANAPLLKLPVNIPEANEHPSAEIADPETLLITVGSVDSPWLMEEDEYKSWDSLKAALENRLSGITSASDLRVSIAADRQAPVESLVNLMAFLSERQLADVQILMRHQD